MRPGGSGHLLRQVVFAALALAAIASFVALAPPPAAANRIAATREDAAAARDRLDDLAADLEERSEEYLSAERQLAETRTRLQIAADELVIAERDVAASEEIFNRRVTAMYRSGWLDVLSVLVGVSDFRDLVTRIDLLRRIGSSDAAVVERLDEARRRRSGTSARLERRRVEQTALLRSVRARRREVERALSSQKAYLAKIDSTLSRLIAEERERRERAARQRAAAAAASASAKVGSAGRVFDSDALGVPHSEVVAVARQFVGRTDYVWGGTTPSGFDCSGLTLYSYRAVGIGLPRTSREQYRFGAFIPPDRLDLLAPGDLVFFGRDGDPGRIHHVGIYSGEGKFIHAPQTGMKVSESSLLGRIAEKGDFVGATRP